MKPKYRVMIVGMGKRGVNHLIHFQNNRRFKIAGICDKNPIRLREGLKICKYCKSETDAGRISKEVKPDVFCICTNPDSRIELVEIAAALKVSLIALEKPIALNLNDAIRIKQLIKQNDIKTVVCLQHRYGKHYQKIKEIVSKGELGAIDTIQCSSKGWMMHLLPHLVDLMLWYNDYKKSNWVMAQGSGIEKLAGDHPSPDYIFGVVEFTNGVKGIVECGVGASDISDVSYLWYKNRIRIIGSLGFAEVVTGNGWRVVSSNRTSTGKGCMNYDLDMPEYIGQIADWLDDEKNTHPCNFENAYKGFEIIMGFCRSIFWGGQISLPLEKGINEIEALKMALTRRKS